VDSEAVAQQVRAELMQKISASLGLGGALPAPAPAGAGAGAPAAAAPAAAGGDAVWIDSPECTACDECTKLAPKIFAYNENKKAIVINPRGGKYADIVKAAEKCTASCLHPGQPWNMSEPGVDKLIARAAKFN
jgi:pyruvate-ferredoxin/flavodoxin oxidoreductase